MDLRPFLTSLLLAAPTALAQGTSDKPAGEAPGVATPQEKASPQEKSAGQILEDLAKEKERLEKEIQFAKQRVANAPKMLAEKLGNRGQGSQGQGAIRSIDAGTNAPPVAAITRPKLARVMTKEEAAAAGGDTLLTVNGQPIKQGEFDVLMEYLKGLTNTGTDEQRAQRVLFELIRIQAVASAFPENSADGQASEAFGLLENGTAIGELTSRYGSVFGANDGKIELTRNSVHGLRLEQIGFATEEGKHTRPFRTAFGNCILQVLKAEKGQSPELDKRTVAVVQVKYMADEAQLNMAQASAARGQVDILCRDDGVLGMLPMMYRPQEAPAVPTSPLNGLLQSLESVEKSIQALSADASSEDAKAQLESLKIQREKLKSAIADMQKSGAAGATDGGGLDIPKKAPEPIKQ